MADAFALASAAAERRKASAPRLARCRVRNISERRRLLVRRGNGWHAPFGASPPFFAGGESIFWCVFVRQSSDAKKRRENDLRYPPPRSETERGRGTMPTGPARSGRPDDRLRWSRGRAPLRLAVRPTPFHRVLPPGAIERTLRPSAPFTCASKTRRMTQRGGSRA